MRSLRSIVLAVVLCRLVNAEDTSREDWAFKVRMGAELYRAGRTAEAGAAWRKALSDAGQSGMDPAAVVAVWSDLGTLNWQLGRFQDAENAYRRGLSELEQALPGSPRVILRCADMLIFYVHTDQLGKAERFERRCRESSWWNSSSQEMAHMLVAVGMLRNLQHRFDDAEALLNQALSIEQKGDTPDAQLRADATVNLGAVYYRTSRNDDAVRLFKRALATEEARLGASSPALIPYLNDVGLGYHAAGRESEAAVALERAIALADKAFPKDHPVRGRLLGNYARILKNLHRAIEAKAVAKQAREICRQSAEARGLGLVVDVSDLTRTQTRQ
jgi:tetratricopeptide (TPR) repeat protein